MAFTSKEWKDGESGKTPLSAAALIDLEERLAKWAEEVLSGATISTSQIASNAVTAGKLATNAVEAAKIKAEAVEEGKLAAAVKTKLAEGGTVKTAVAASGLAIVQYDPTTETWGKRPADFANVIWVSPVKEPPKPPEAEREDGDQVVAPLK